HQTTQVERARIEQLENQLRRLTSQADRIALEREALAAQAADEQLALLSNQEAHARAGSERLANALNGALNRVQTLRAEQLAVESRLESARAERERIRAELVSLEALQKAALSRDAGQANEWLAGAGLGNRARLAAAVDVEAGWERAVETALGDYLEAVCVDSLEEVSTALDGLSSGRAALIENGGA